MNVAKLTENQVQLASENEELEAKALVDDLTRIWNRGAIHEIARRELEVAIPIDGGSLTVTLSAGVGSSGGAATVASMLATADEALYCAKRSGRDRVA